MNRKGGSTEFQVALYAEGNAAELERIKGDDRYLVEGLRPPVGGGSSASPRGLKLFIEAQASTGVPSTEKCSLERSLLTRGCARRAAKNAAATSPARSRSRFFENVE